MLNYFLQRPYLAFMFLLTIITILVSDHVFFWDTVQLGSKHAHWFYENGFNDWILPEEIDSGHPPIFGAYLALLWKLFGKSLLTSHMAILPFLWAISYLVHRLACLFANPEYSIYFLLIFFLDPVVSTQSILISPDIVLLCFFLLTLLAVVEGKKTLLLIGIVALNLISMRGMMVSLGFLIFELFKLYSIHKPLANITIPKIFNTLRPYLPGMILATVFLSYHYFETGWIAYHESSPWAPSFDEIGFKGFFRNVAVIIWRMLDFGRVFVWLGIVFFSIGIIKKKLVLNKKSKDLGILFVCLCLVLLPGMLLHKGLLAHRYLLPLFVILNLFLFYCFFGISAQKNTELRRFFIIIILGLFAGNLWMYPKSISQGWDASLAHLPYYDLRNEMISFIDENEIPFSSIGTAFPDIGPMKFKDLSENLEGFREKNLSASPYILYSNIMNDYTDQEIDILGSIYYTEIFHIEKKGIVFILYEKSGKNIK